MCTPCASLRPGALRCLDANAGGRQRSAYELPQVEETGCFGAALAARVVPGFIAISAKPNVTYSTRYAPAAGYGRASALPTKIPTLSTLIAALQGYHARIKEHTL